MDSSGVKILSLPALVYRNKQNNGIHGQTEQYFCCSRTFPFVFRTSGKYNDSHRMSVDFGTLLRSRN